jgi:dipeptidyl aminopeptidase/acylaminoacyl peptidase
MNGPRARSMRKWAAFAAATLVFNAIRPAHAAPLEAYGRLPSIETVRISPDGRTLAFVKTAGEQRTVTIQPLDPQKKKVELNAGQRKLRGLQWAGSHHLIVTTSVSGYIRNAESSYSEWFLAVDVDLAKNTQRPLISEVPRAMNVVDGPPDIRFIDGRPFAFAEGIAFRFDNGQPTLFKIDLDHADSASIQTRGSDHTVGFVVDAHGSTLARSSYDDAKGRWALEMWTGDWQAIYHEDAPIETPQLRGLGRDGASILVSFGEHHRSVLREMKPDGSGWSNPLPVTDPDRLIWDSKTYRLIGESALVGENERYKFYDPADQRAWDAISTAFPGERVDLVSFTDDHRKFVVRVSSATHVPAYVLANLDGDKNLQLGDEYEGLKSQDIASVRLINFQAQDGLRLSGYLTLPVGRDPKKLPLVVFPHGGPAARDPPGFNWWAQAMASRGYAVLQVNFRGSDGFGWDFLSAGFGQWGRKMQTDLSDGVRYLAGEGTIDPKRVCIVGASYGGYAALAGATIDSGVYRCAVSVAGPADLRKFIGLSKAGKGGKENATQRYWTRYMGEEALLGDISPSQQAHRASIPILLIHGEDDIVVPYEQSRIMADALRRAGKPVEFVTLKGEDHWLSRGQTRLQMLHASVAFLEKNNPPN